MQKTIKILTLILVLLPLSLIRFGTSYSDNLYGRWTAPADIQLDKIVIMKAGLPRQTFDEGAGADTVVATITEETTKVSPWLFMPIVQRGYASATAIVELRVGATAPTSLTVEVKKRYVMFGLLPNIFIRTDLRSQIDKTIHDTIKTRI